MIGPAVAAGLVALVLVAAGAVVPGLPAILVRLLPAALLAVALPLRTPEPERVGEGVIGLLPGLPVLLARLLLGLLLRLLLAVGLRILDRVVGRVDLVHFLRGGLVAGVLIGVVFHGQLAVGLPDLVFRSVRRYAEHLIRICSHAVHFLFLSNMLIIPPLFGRSVKLL